MEGESERQMGDGKGGYGMKSVSIIRSSGGLLEYSK